MKWAYETPEQFGTAARAAMAAGGGVPVRESRCAHGFLLSMVPCPHGCSRAATTRRHVPNGIGADGKRRQYNFTDLTGKTFGTWTIIGEEASKNGNSRWRARHKCGAVHVLEGIRLRNKPAKFCPSCRPRKLERRIGEVG